MKLNLHDLGSCTDSSPSQHSAKAGLYIHIPCCRFKCPYCDFYSEEKDKVPYRWIEAILKEASIRKGTFESFDSLYIGGGTPSLVEPEDLSILMSKIEETFDFSERCESTLEANPEDISREAIEAWHSMGINRLSIGIQSFDDATLRRLGRRHDSSRARKSLELALEAGFDNLSIDLIYGIPGQSIESWKKTLDIALQYEPKHLSCYELTIHARSQFARMVAAGKMRTVSETKSRRLFVETASFLLEKGYLQYEVSNFARSRDYICRHNRRYWMREPYLGLGPSAHSFDGQIRWWNIRSIEKYLARLDACDLPIEDSEIIDDERHLLETLFLGFRTNFGVPLEILRMCKDWEISLEQLAKGGFVRIENGRIMPTLDGLCVANQLPLVFLR